MPRLSLWYLRAAFLNLLIGVTLGALMLTAKALPGWGWAWTAFPSHIEMMAYGWMMQFAMGVAFWALPRYLHPPKRGDGRPAWAAWALLNSGVILIAIAPYAPFRWLRPTGASLEVLSVILFACYVWPRIKPVGT